MPEAGSPVVLRPANLLEIPLGLPEIHPQGCQKKLLTGWCVQRPETVYCSVAPGAVGAPGNRWLLGADSLCRLPSSALPDITRKTGNVVYSAKSPSTYQPPGPLLC